MQLKRGIILILGYIILSTSFACANRVNSDQSSESNSLPTAMLLETYKIIQYDSGSLLLCKMTEEDAGGQLYTLSLDGCNIMNETGNEFPRDNLKNGMLVALASGTITEIYPSELIGVYSITVYKQENDVVGFYFDMITRIFAENGNINTGIDMISLDLTGVSNLTESEKSALEYLVSCEYPLEIRRNTIDELKEEGLITKNYFEKGIVIIIKGQATSDDSILFSISKYRGGLSGYGYDNWTANISGNTWEEETGETFVA